MQQLGGITLFFNNLFLLSLEKIILHRFLDYRNGNLEKAKTFIEYSYTFRNKHPKIFLRRDPLEAKLKLALKVM